jgi:hypothetical protein
MRSLKPVTPCLSDLAFDQSFAGELEPLAAAELAAHVAECARCSVRRDLLQRQREGFLERVPTWDLLVQRRRRPAPDRRVVALALGGIALAAAAALFVVRPDQRALGLRSKGRPQLGMFVKHGERVVRAESGDRVQPGDDIRLVYSSLKAIEFAVLHRDARAASVYFPLASQTRAMQPGKDVPLDFSVRLDPQPGDEQFYGLFCEARTELEPLRAALAQTGHIPVRAGCQVDTLMLTKQSDGK